MRLSLLCTFRPGAQFLTQCNPAIGTKQIKIGSLRFTDAECTSRRALILQRERLLSKAFGHVTPPYSSLPDWQQPNAALDVLSKLLAECRR